MSLFSTLLFLAHHLTVPVPAGEAVVRAAYARYEGKWFKTATWIEMAGQVGGTRPETWYEALQLPGMLRIDIAPLGTGRALIYRNDSSYAYGRSQLRKSGPDVNPLVLLVHDLHVLPPAKMLPRLKGLGFDMSKSHETMWQGKRAVVVGALKGDSTSDQFWLEKERLILVRIIHNARVRSEAYEARVAGYQRAGGGWLPRSIETYVGGRLWQREEYTNVKVGMPHEPGLFDPSGYHVPKWVGEMKDLFGELPPMPQLKRGGP